MPRNILKINSNKPYHSNRRPTENETSRFCPTDDNNETQQRKIYIRAQFIFVCTEKITQSRSCLSKVRYIEGIRDEVIRNLVRNNRSSSYQGFVIQKEFTYDLLARIQVTGLLVRNSGKFVIRGFVIAGFHCRFGPGCCKKSTATPKLIFQECFIPLHGPQGAHEVFSSKMPY